MEREAHPSPGQGRVSHNLLGLWNFLERKGRSGWGVAAKSQVLYNPPTSQVHQRVTDTKEKRLVDFVGKS